MKRGLWGFPIFLVAFFAGYLLVPEFKTMLTDQQPPNTLERVDQPNANAAPIVATSKVKDFVPEFRGLPNFEDAYDGHYLDAGEELIQILDDGIYRRSEVVAKSGEKWLVFFDQNGKHSLSESTASVKKLNSVSWPGDEKDARLAFKGIKGIGKPVFALKNVRGLRPGRVNTLFHRPLWKDISESDFQEQELDDGFRREFRLNETSYVLRVSKGLTRDGTEVAVLVLESNGVSQVIKQTYHVPSDERDIVGSLLWAGDIDRDGKLDLYFDEFNEKGFTSIELHLSSYAASGELVGFVASFGMAGC